MSLNAVMKGAVMAVLVGCSSLAEATWEWHWSEARGTWYTDGTWEISQTGSIGDITGADGTVFGKCAFYQIVAGPDDGDLDMSTMTEDLIACSAPDWAMPVGMYGSFSMSCISKRVRSIKFPSGIKVVNGWNWDAQTTLTNVVFGAGIHTIGAGFFNGQTALVSVSGLENVKYIQDNAFNNCTQLRSVEPYLPTGVVSIAESAFGGCSLLTGDLHLSSPFYTNVKGRFGNPMSIDFNDVITNISLSGLSSVTNVGPFPAALQKINGCFGGQTGGPVKFDFSSCTNLTEIPDYFAWGSRVLELKLPPRIRRIGVSTFSNCGLLTNVSYVAQKRFRDEMLAASGEIAEGAFAGAYMNRNFEIPWGGAETTIATNAFRGCRELRTIRFAGPPPVSYPADLFTSYGDVGGAVDYRLHILGSKRHAAAWRAFATRAATDAEKARPDCPEKRLYGIFDSSLDGTSFHNLAWVVGEMGCWDEPQGLSVLIR